ncbi:bifunctional DNA-formamidopyrimidine glycosylase/DNA-(apurinic or apyrimidinic site) lyase [Planctomonas deserti]|uniref:bifunctional DNA-formamidopyrimidine glycosylase/DNA-(apurinic or apyrimidinic site) lyase n=1 Tax=Planctomonas deserti TaxID=2144185 RepID=UPI000D3923F2|nr:bifunctional DNA-formamidopyrimidine glycosylase/DNA-(apurinic or apyrimidinic site) lyase [Planctomonas deserti]
MPELPEVEVVRAGLEPAVTGAVVHGVEVFDERSLRRHDRTRGSFESLLTGARIASAVRRGKFLWFPLEPAAVPEPHGVPEPRTVPEPVEGTQRISPEGRSTTPAPADRRLALVTHLGMSGQVLLRSPGAADDALLRIRLHIEHPEHGELWLHFVDQRIFGSMAVDALLPTEAGLPAGFGSDLPLIPSQVAHIARDPLDPNFDDAAFFRALARRNTGIKRALLDQTLVSGIGNIYADEALWASRIHFDQSTRELSRPRAKTLLAEVRLVLARALAEGGTSFDSQYVNVNGASGYFSHSLNAYGQHGRPCPRCGRLIARATFMNRSSHFCPYCQRLRAPRTARPASPSP